MSELTLSTPSILFSAISLIMLAYTNRFGLCPGDQRTGLGPSLKSEREQGAPNRQSPQKVVYDPVDAGAGYQQPVFVRSVHIFYLHWFSADGCIYFWGGLAAAYGFVGNIGNGNSDFGEGS